MEAKYNFVYRVLNKLNGKQYIGVHSTVNLEDGYLGSGTNLRRALKKYGPENFEREILLFCQTLEEAYQKEKELVTEAYVQRRDTYNINTGGFQPPSQKGRPRSEAAKIATSKALKGRKKSLEHNKAVSEALKGRKLSEQHRESLSKANKGRTAHNKGKPLSEESVIRRTITRVQNHQNYKPSPELQEKIDNYLTRIKNGLQVQNI
jgi:group I intron endonuclease